MRCRGYLSSLRPPLIIRLSLPLILPKHLFFFCYLRKQHPGLHVRRWKDPIGDGPVQKLSRPSKIFLLDQRSRRLELPMGLLSFLVPFVGLHLGGMEQLRHIRMRPKRGEGLLRQIDRIRQLLALDLAANLLDPLLYFPLNPFAILLFLDLLFSFCN